MGNACWKCEKKRKKMARTKVQHNFFWLAVSILGMMAILSWLAQLVATEGVPFRMNVVRWFGIAEATASMIFLWPTMLGWDAARFKDADKIQHDHIGWPDWHDEAFHDAKGRPISGPILLVPEFSWGRRPQILQYAGEGIRSVVGPWQAIRRVDGFITFLGPGRGEVSVLIEDALDLIKEERSPIQAYSDARLSDRYRAQLVESGEEIRALERQRHALGRRVQAIIKFLRDSKNAQNSKTAQRTREYLELTIYQANITMGQIESWIGSAPEVLEGLEIQLARMKETGSPYAVPASLILPKHQDQGIQDLLQKTELQDASGDSFMHQ